MVGTDIALTLLLHDVGLRLCRRSPFVDDEHITRQWAMECHIDLTQDHIDWEAY